MKGKLIVQDMFERDPPQTLSEYTRARFVFHDDESDYIDIIFDPLGGLTVRTDGRLVITPEATNGINVKRQVL